MIFVISDTHFYHKNIIGYEQRPFNNVFVMNEYMISAWNSVVKNDDYVIHCGDFSFGSSADIKEIKDRLNGNIILIKGNHDKKNTRFYENIGFYDIFRTHIKLNSSMIIFSHRPYKKMSKDYINVHGHTHSSSGDFLGKRYINCCVEKIEYIPISLFDLFKSIDIASIVTYELLCLLKSRKTKEVGYNKNKKESNGR